MALKNWLSNNLQKFKLLYPANRSTYMDVTLTWRWYIRYLNLTWVVSLRFLQIGRYMPLKKWLSNNLKKLKVLSPANPLTYIDVTWHDDDIYVTSIWHDFRLSHSYRSGQIRLWKIEFWITFKNLNFSILQTFWLTLTWIWHDDDKYVTSIWHDLSLRLLQVGRYMAMKNWLSNKLQKLKLLYPANTLTYIDVTLTWRWHLWYLKLTRVLSLSFLQIGRYMPLKNDFRIPVKIQKSSILKTLWLTLTWLCHDDDIYVTSIWHDFCLSYSYRSGDIWLWIIDFRITFKY
jgi:hypothetical protein